MATIADSKLEEIERLRASLEAEYRELRHPSWEGVAAHREDDMERLFLLLREITGPDAAA